MRISIQICDTVNEMITRIAVLVAAPTSAMIIYSTPSGAAETGDIIRQFVTGSAAGGISTSPGATLDSFTGKFLIIAKF